MDITMIGLQNAGKTSLLKVLAVSHRCEPLFIDWPTDINHYRAGSSPSSTFLSNEPIGVAFIDSSTFATVP